MTHLGIEITIESPTLVAAAPPASNLTETLTFLPGNSLRGAFARRWLELGGSPEDELFQRLFVRGEARFGNATKNGAEAVPLSARSCKYHGGFTADDGHGVIDLLLAAGDADGAPTECPDGECGESLDDQPGYWLPAAAAEITVSTRLITRTAIDPRRGSAASGQLFIQQVIAEDQSFLGAIEARSAAACQELERLIGKGFDACLGSGGSRGQGWVEVRPAAVPAGAADAEPAGSRYRRCRRRAGRPVLAVTLLSDGLFRDDYLRAATAPSLADLATLGVVAEDWEPQPALAFADTRPLFGFDGEPVRLPRPHRLAVVAGSSFLYEAQRQPASPEGPGIGWIGERQREGFGRAVLWHPFHLGPDPGLRTAEERP